MKLLELTMPLNHRWMPDEALPTSVRFFLGPKNHPEKGMVIGSDSGTCLTLPSVFEAFRKTARLDEVAVDQLVLRSTTVLPIPKTEGQEIDEADAERAFDSARPHKGDAILVATGWGDKDYGESYLLGSPHFTLHAAQYLAKRMKENESNLLLVDTALIGWPDKHLIPEWCSLLPTPGAESAEARMYLHLYDSDKAKKDFAVEMEFARAGIMTVRKVVHCGQIKKDKIKIIVSPLKVVRGVASTCRVVALED
jgi:kynurenine formamidase